jgi:molecular chaperone GrpE
MNEKGEDTRRPADQPGIRTPSAELASPPPATAPPTDGQDSAALRELADQLARVESQLAGFHQRAAYQESVIDRLHEENQLLRRGLSRTVLDPVVTDLIRLHDQLSKEVRRQAASGIDAQLTWSFAEDVAQILDRCGIEMFSAEPGDPFDHRLHRPLAVVPCTDESQHNTVAEVIACGFTDRETGRVRRHLEARFYRYAAEPQ